MKISLKIKVLDKFYRMVETKCGRISNWAWHKRWHNRETGTGYKAYTKRKHLINYLQKIRVVRIYT